MGAPVGYCQHSSGYWMRTADQAGPFTYDGATMVPVEPQNTLNVDSGAIANGVAAATLPAAPGKYTFLNGFEITGSGALLASPVVATLTGIIGGPLRYVFSAPAGALVGAMPLQITFDPPLKSADVNTPITMSLPALGTGNTSASVCLHGFQA